MYNIYNSLKIPFIAPVPIYAVYMINNLRKTYKSIHFIIPMTYILLTYSCFKKNLYDHTILGLFNEFRTKNDFKELLSSNSLIFPLDMSIQAIYLSIQSPFWYAKGALVVSGSRNQSMEHSHAHIYRSWHLSPPHFIGLGKALPFPPSFSYTFAICVK